MAANVEREQRNARRDERDTYDSMRAQERFRGEEARTRRAEAEAARAERQPSSSSSGSLFGSSSRRGRGRSPIERQLSRITASRPRRVLVAEFLMVLLVTTVGEFSDKHSPRPSSYMAQLIVFTILGFAAELGDSSARLAQAFGGLVLLAVVIANAPAILDAFDVISSKDKTSHRKPKGERKKLRDVIPGGKLRGGQTGSQGPHNGGRGPAIFAD